MNSDELGVMLDLSRGKVFSVSTIKRLAKYAKSFGYTYINLYIEDLLILEEFPAYGYLRGAYTDDEVREIVNYCISIDLDVYPAIQTLGHLEHFLAWKESDRLKDTNQVLNVVNGESKVFLKALINKCRLLFQSNKINIGMDEAFDLGQGALNRAGNNLSQKQLYLNHLDEVVTLCKQNGFETIKVWSDMLFNVYSNAGGEGLYSFSKQTHFEQMNNNVELVYWNYWSCDETEYIETIEIHKKFTNNISMALGIHTWGLPFYNKEQLKITETALKAAKKEGINDLLFTMWGDDGSLYNLDSAIYGMYLSAVGTKNECPIPEFFEEITGLNFQSLEIISKICNCGINPLHIIWNDPITNIKLKTLNSTQLRMIEQKATEMLIMPTNLNEEIYNLYLTCMLNDIRLFSQETVSSELIDVAKSDLKTLFEYLEALWLREAKPNGIEELQGRFTTKLYRYEFLKLHKNELKIERTNIMGVSPVSDNYSSISKATKFRW